MYPSPYAYYIEHNSPNGTKPSKTMTLSLDLNNPETGSLGFVVGINSKAIVRIDEIWLES